MKELTYEDWIKNPTPRMMWCWNVDVENKVQTKVIYVINHDIYPVIALTDNDADLLRYKHCAEIEEIEEIEEPKRRRMTNKELSRWLRGNLTREYKYSNAISCSVYSSYTYTEYCENEEVSKDIVIREDDGEWREPLVEVEE